MAHSDEQKKLDRATVDSGKCPECRIDLATVHVLNHAATCLPHGDDPAKRDSDHARRYRLLTAYQAGRATKE